MPLGRLSLTSENLALFNFYKGRFTMRQIIYVHVEKGIVQFSDLDIGMEFKQLLNDKGIKARVRMRTPKKANE